MHAGVCLSLGYASPVGVAFLLLGRAFVDVGYRMAASLGDFYEKKGILHLCVSFEGADYSVLLSQSERLNLLA
ncbi:hypothetical protein JGUZn3_09410 [Entomobacter blattae]|uniref:Uncharacterized protein n=1 Tax=Entomobacter blattae TaxID=2762277 RepID=A0A7H1NQW2_9PROT|nr:hypothetical protein JGUZn3_09410 [Entomobacter blattae]